MDEHKTHAKRGLKKGPGGLYSKPGALVLTALIIALGVVVGGSVLLRRGEQINKNGYQVVYMSSGQAYFGKLRNTSGDYLVIDTPYSAQDVKPDSETTAQSSTTLLKVSQQQYGPEDAMSLKSDQVLFWQNLRDDSKVAQAIKNEK